MPRATSVSITPPEAVSAAPPAATRRLTLTALAWCAIATPVATLAPTKSHAEGASTDPVVALYARWVAANTASHAADERAEAVRSDLTRRHGEIVGWDASVIRAWKSDPQHAELHRLNAESDHWIGEYVDILDLMIETPATSAEGAACKIKTLATSWGYIENPNANPSWHEEMTLAFLRDAGRVLGGGRPA